MSNGRTGTIGDKNVFYSIQRSRLFNDLVCSRACPGQDCGLETDGAEAGVPPEADLIALAAEIGCCNSGEMTFFN